MRTASTAFIAISGFVLLAGSACTDDSEAEDEAGTIGGDTGDNCPLPTEAPDATGDQELMVAALEQLDTGGTGWSASTRHDAGNDCITVTIRTGGEEIPDDELESYQADVEDATGLENVRIIQDDSGPDQLDS